MNPSEQIDNLIAQTQDWRGATLAKLRKTILEVDPEIAELAGNKRRAIEIYEGDHIDEGSLKALIRAAISYNQAKGKK